MSIRYSLAYVCDLLFKKGWEQANTPEQVEARELEAGKRFGRGNVRVQEGAVLTPRMAKEKEKQFLARAARRHVYGR